MIKSMTGYGHGTAVIDGLDITVEMKSVNHRYFEFSIRTSRGYTFLEEKLKSFVQSKVSRGKIDMYVSISAVDDTEVSITLNPSLATGYVNALRELSSAYGLSGEISADSVARFPDVFNIRRLPKDEEKVWAAVEQVASQAVEGFIAMRENEGKKLKEDVEHRAAKILEMVGFIEEQSPRTTQLYMERLRARIDELLGDVKADEQRIITEVAIFADKIAVAEETVRLRSHFDQMKKMLESGEPVGRKLDFIVQEMNREANTIGSKAQDASIAHVVVEIKSEIEKIREQIQNIE